MNRFLACLLALGLALAWGPTARAAGAASPLDELPSYIHRASQFGQRADWSHDGKRILFIEKTFGDVYELELATGTIRPMTHHYFHEGYTRALYLANGDILLSGSRTFDATRPWDSRFLTAELWVLSKELNAPPVPLGEFAWEGPAASRTAMTIAWAANDNHRPDLPKGTWQIWTGTIEYTDGTPALTTKTMVLDNRTLPKLHHLEPQNFRPGNERELTVQISGYGDANCEVYLLDLPTGKLVNHSNLPGSYDEPEGIFPDGRATLVESTAHQPDDNQAIDLYKLALDGSGTMTRITYFCDYPGFKATNPVVSDDGRYMAFQYAQRRDVAGIGHGVMILDLQAWETEQRAGEHQAANKK